MTKIQKFFKILKLQNKPKILRVLTLKWSKKRVRTIHLNSHRLLPPVSDLVCLFFCFLHFENLEKKIVKEKITLKKTKQKSAFFFPKASVLCFVLICQRQTLPQTKWAEFFHLSQSFVSKGLVFLFFLWTKRVNTYFLNKKFSEKFFLFFGQSIFDTNLLEKRCLFFFLWQNQRVYCVVFQNCFLLFFTDVQLWQHLEKF